MKPYRRSAGFSLVELMVGIVVAMVAVIVIMQVFRMTEGHRRSTTGGDDAQTTSAIALAQLQREIRQSGLGVVNASLLACSLDLGVGRTLSNLATVIINDASVAVGDANTDTLLLVYGSAQGAAEGIPIVTQAGTSFSVKAVAGTRGGDYIVAVPQVRATPCNLQLSITTANPVGVDITLNKAAAGLDNGGLFNLGPSPRIVAYAVRNGSLTLCDMLTQNCGSADPANWVEVADGIVSLRAQYVQAAGGFDQSTPGTCLAWHGVSGLRLAMVARNSQYSSEEVTLAAPTWAGTGGAPITLANDWKHYRYRTLEATLPLRNIVNVNPYYAATGLSPC